MHNAAILDERATSCFESFEPTGEKRLRRTKNENEFSESLEGQDTS